MNVLIIDKNAIIPVYQKKWELLSNYENVNLTLLVPNRWKENFSDIYFYKNKTKKLSIISGKVIFPGYENRGFYYTSLIKAIKRSKPDIIQLMEEPYSLFSIQTIMVKNLFAPKAKVIFYTYDNISYNYIFPYRPSFLYEFIEKFTFKNSDYALCANKEAKEILLSKGFNKHIKILYPCFDFSFFKRMESEILKNELGLKGVVIGFIGRITKEKGLDTLLRACGELQEEFTLIIVGKGDYKFELIKLAKEMGIIQKIRFIDVLKYEEVPKYLSLLDIFVLPSITTKKWKEQFGRIIIEAMVCEVAVIGSNSGAIPEIIGNNGLIFRENDYFDLKNKILLLIKDKELRDRLKLLGKRYVKNFSMDNFVNELYLVYNDLICFNP